MYEILIVCPKCKLRRIRCESDLEDISGGAEIAMGSVAACAGCGAKYQISGKIELLSVDKK